VFRRCLHIKDTPATLQEVVQVIAAFLLPVTEALVTGQPFYQRGGSRVVVGCLPMPECVSRYSGFAWFRKRCYNGYR
jgi:hypothetical protein